MPGRLERGGAWGPVEARPRSLHFDSWPFETPSLRRGQGPKPAWTSTGARLHSVLPFPLPATPASWVDVRRRQDLGESGIFAFCPSPTGQPTKTEAIRLLIRQKLQDSRLPYDGIPRFWGGPSEAEQSNASDKSDGCSRRRWDDDRRAGGRRRRPASFHIEAERRPDSTSAAWSLVRAPGGAEARS